MSLLSFGLFQTRRDLWQQQKLRSATTARFVSRVILKSSIQRAWCSTLPAARRSASAVADIRKTSPSAMASTGRLDSNLKSRPAHCHPRCPSHRVHKARGLGLPAQIPLHAKSRLTVGQSYSRTGKPCIAVFSHASRMPPTVQAWAMHPLGMKGASAS